MVANRAEPYVRVCVCVCVCALKDGQSRKVKESELRVSILDSRPFVSRRAAVKIGVRVVENGNSVVEWCLAPDKRLNKSLVSSESFVGMDELVVEVQCSKSTGKKEEALRFLSRVALKFLGGRTVWTAFRPSLSHCICTAATFYRPLPTFLCPRLCTLSCKCSMKDVFVP